MAPSYGTDPELVSSVRRSILEKESGPQDKEEGLSTRAPAPDIERVRKVEEEEKSVNPRSPLGSNQNPLLQIISSLHQEGPHQSSGVRQSWGGQDCVLGLSHSHLTQ